MSIQQPENKTTTPSPTPKAKSKQSAVSEWLGEHAKLIFLQSLLDNLSSRDNIDRAVLKTGLLIPVDDSKNTKAYSLSAVASSINSEELAKAEDSVLIKSSQLQFKIEAGQINQLFKNKDLTFMLQVALQNCDCPFNLGDELTFKQKIVFLAALTSAYESSLDFTFQQLNLHKETDKKIKKGVCQKIIYLQIQSLTAVFTPLKLYTQNLHTQAYPTLFEVEFNFDTTRPLTTARWDKISPTFHNVLAAEIDKQALRYAIVQRKLEILAKLMKEPQKDDQRQVQIGKILQEFYNDSDLSHLQLQRILSSLNKLDPSPSQTTESCPSPTSLPQLPQAHNAIEEMVALTTVIVDSKTFQKNTQRKWTAGTLFRIEVARLLGLTDEFYEQMKYELHAKLKAAVRIPKDSEEILSLFMIERYGDAAESVVCETMEKIFLATNDIVPLVEAVASSRFQEAELLLNNPYKNFQAGGSIGYEKSFAACSLALQIMSKNTLLKKQVDKFMDTMLQDVAAEIRDVQAIYQKNREFTSDKAKEVDVKTKKNKVKTPVQFDTTEEIIPEKIISDEPIDDPIADFANKLEEAILTIKQKTWTQWTVQTLLGSYHQELKDLLENDRLNENLAPSAILMLYEEGKSQIAEQVYVFLDSVKQTCAWAQGILEDYDSLLKKRGKKDPKPEFNKFLKVQNYKKGRFQNVKSNEKEAEILEIMSIAYNSWKPCKKFTLEEMILTLQKLPANTTPEELENIEKNWKGENPDSDERIPYYIKANTIYEQQNQEASTPLESKELHTKEDDLSKTSTQETTTSVDEIKSTGLPDQVSTQNLDEDTAKTEPDTRVENISDPENNPSNTPVLTSLPEPPSQPIEARPEITILPLQEAPQVSSQTSNPNKTNDPAIRESGQQQSVTSLTVVEERREQTSTVPKVVANNSYTFTSQMFAPRKTPQLNDEKKPANTITETPALRQQVIALLENNLRITYQKQPSQYRCWEFLFTNLSDPDITLNTAIQDFKWRLASAQRNYNLRRGQIAQTMGVGLLSLSAGLESWAILTLFVLSEYSKLATQLSPTAMFVGFLVLMASTLILSQAKESREIGQAFADASTISLRDDVENLLAIANALGQDNAQDLVFLPNPSDSK